MANYDGKKISQLPEAATLESSDLLVVVQQGITKHIKYENVPSDSAELQAHIADTNNPHQVTAVQVGADPAGTASSALAAHVEEANPHPQYASGDSVDDLTSTVQAIDGNLQAHIADTNNPHQVTAVQVGADPAGTASSALAAHVEEDNPHPQYASGDTVDDLTSTVQAIDDDVGALGTAVDGLGGRVSALESEVQPLDRGGTGAMDAAGARSNLGLGSAATKNVDDLGAISGVTSINGGPLAGFRNKIINGNFDIWQRGTSFTGVSNGTFGPDRWVVQTFFGSTVNVSRVAGPNLQSRHALRVQKATHPSTDSPIEINQRIEGLRRFSGKTITITFDLRVNGEREFHIWLQGRYGTGGSPSPLENYYSGTEGDAVTISPGTGWARFRKVYTVPDLSSRTFGTDENDSLVIRFRDPYSVLNDWFDLTRVSVVEGNAGSEDDPFEDRPLGVELALCQRYFQTSYGLGLAPGSAPREDFVAERFSTSTERNEAIITVLLTPEMRATPVVTPYSWKTGASGNACLIGAGDPDIPVTLVGFGTSRGFRLRPTSALPTAPVRIGYMWTADSEI